MRSVELFTGAGGLALGLAEVGFRHELIAEWDRDACETIRENQRRRFKLVADWPVVEPVDVRTLDYSTIRPGVDLLAGGPPCQPFSLAGKHKGYNDHRDMFPEAARAVRELVPTAFVFENVRGLLRQSFASYFEYILLRLAYPEITRRPDEEWTDHRARLEQHQTSGSREGLYYNVVFQQLNAVDYGVPQRRDRVFIVGFRSDLNVEWSFPRPTHSLDALLRDEWITGEYWDRHRVALKDRPELPAQFQARIERLRSGLVPVDDQPWATVRDAIHDLPDPLDPAAARIPNHRYQPGARPYVGHTGSPLDEPSKTLKAGDHGVPGGENTVLYPDGRLRYLTVRESARVQTFPDEYVVCGSWTESMRQLGNAVPVLLGRVVAESIAAGLSPGLVRDAA